MSTQAIEAFRSQLAADPALQEEVKATLAGGSAAIVSLAARHGFSFSAQELEAAASDAELSDLELEMAGGNAGLICGNGGGAKG